MSPQRWRSRRGRIRGASAYANPGGRAPPRRLFRGGASSASESLECKCELRVKRAAARIGVLRVVPGGETGAVVRERRVAVEQVPDAEVDARVLESGVARLQVPRTVAADAPGPCADAFGVARSLVTFVVTNLKGLREGRGPRSAAPDKRSVMTPPGHRT